MNEQESREFNSISFNFLKESIISFVYEKTKGNQQVTSSYWFWRITEISGKMSSSNFTSQSTDDFNFDMDSQNSILTKLQRAMKNEKVWLLSVSYKFELFCCWL